MTHDKVSWHHPDGEGCPSPERAKQHIGAVLDWLAEQGLLSDFGKEIHELPVGADTAITSDMLTDEGDRLLSERYDVWLGTIDYTRPTDPEGLGDPSAGGP